MLLSFKRSLAAAVACAVLTGAVPQTAYQAMAAGSTQGPGNAASLPGVTLPQGAALPQALGATAASLNAVTAGAASATRAPLEIKVPEAALEKMTPAQRGNVAAVADLMRQSLFRHSETVITLPGTIFDNGSDSLIKVGDLFKAPQADELERLAAKEGRLSPSQLRRAGFDGTFKVASEDFPGQRHHWQITSWLQKGRKNIVNSRRDDYAGALTHYIDGLPRTISGDGTLSLKSSARNLGVGLWETLGLFIGIAERQAKYDEADIAQSRARAIATFMRSALPKKDTSLYDPAVLEKAAPILQRVQEAADAEWKAKQDAVKDELSRTIKDPQQLADALAQAQQQQLYAALTGNKDLEAVHTGLGALLVTRAKARQAIAQEQAAAAAEVAALVAAAEKALARQHRVRARIPAWINARLAQIRAQQTALVQPQAQARALAALKALGLEEEVKAETQFAQGWQRAQEAMAEQTAASRTFSYRYQIWQRKNWTVTRDEKSGLYSGSQTRRVETSTGFEFWRIGNFLQRWLNLSNNLLHALLVGGVVNGGLGVRALLRSQPFQHRWDLNEQTGQWELAGRERQTLLSRLKGFYAQRRAILDHHEKKGRYAFFIGKGGERVFWFFVADLGLGVISPLLTLVFQPLLTAANVIVSLGLAAATPFVIAPALSALTWAYQALFFDSAGTRYSRWRGSFKKALGLAGLAALAVAAYFGLGFFGINLFSGWWLAGLVAVFAATGPLFPWVGTLLKKAGLNGAAAFVASLVKAAFHLALGPVTAIYGFGRSVLRSLYDAALRVLLRWRATVPSESGKIVKRIGGPGISSEYFFQVSGDLPLLAAWAALEAKELSRFNAETAAFIAQPQQAYLEFAAVLDALTGGSNAPREKAPAFEQIAQDEQKASQALANAVSERQELYGRLLSVPEKGRIKLPAAAIETLLKKTAVLSESFYAKVAKDQAWNEAKFEAFWKSNNLAANDWVGLAKKTLAGIFGEAILVPMETNDKTMRIEVNPPGLEDYVQGLDAGIMPGALDNVAIGDLATSADETAPAAKVPVVRVSDLTRGLF